MSLLVRARSRSCLWVFTLIALAPLPASMARGADPEIAPLSTRTGGQPTGSSSTLPAASNAPTHWTLLADAKLESVSLQDSTSSFGVGLRYRAAKSETSLIVRKGTADTISAPAGAHAFGAFMLAPANAKVGLSFRVDLFANTGVFCPRAVFEKNDGTCPKADVTHGLRYGGYVKLDAGMAAITNTTPAPMGQDQVNNASFAAAAFGIGFSTRFEDEFVLDGTARPLVLGMWIGPTSRVLGGDLSDDQRSTTFGTGTPVWLGAQLGGLVRLGEFDLTASVSWIGYDTKYAIQGLERLQVVPSISFSLPFDILQNNQAGGGNGKTTPANAAASGAPGVASAPPPPAPAPPASSAAPPPAPPPPQ